ncbi:MAG: cysteine--tRNA ligase, partial [Acidobacteriota bacterium]
ENEIAQSEGATGKPFVRYWLHCAHLVIEGEKMSKSLGNFFTLRELLDQGHDPRAIRYVLLGTHYRRPLNFSFSALEQARRELERIEELRDRLRREARETAGRAGFGPRIDEAEQAFGARLDDDLNISGALGEVFRLVRELNTAVDRGEASREDAEKFERFLASVDRVVAALVPWQAREERIDPDVQRLVDEREAARAGKDWAAADRLRDEIQALGYSIEDTPQGARVRRAREG